MATAPTLPNPTLPTTPNPGASGTGSGVGIVQAPTTSLSNPISTYNGNNTVAGDFTASYGQGTGQTLINTLSTLGTGTNQAVQATNQGILNSAGIQKANVYASDAAAGLSKDSSAVALGIGDFDAQVNSTIASTDAQMELSQEDLLINSLFQEGANHGGDSSFMGSLGSVLGGAGGAIGSIFADLI
jgi:hypothetical protein